MTEPPRHIIMAVPLRCFGQMVAAAQYAAEYDAVVHLTAGCYGEPRPKRPGMGSSCMPVDPVRGADRCRHDLAVLRAEGAIDITADWPCSEHEPCAVASAGPPQAAGTEPA